MQACSCFKIGLVRYDVKNLSFFLSMKMQAMIFAFVHFSVMFSLAACAKAPLSVCRLDASLLFLSQKTPRENGTQHGIVKKYSFPQIPVRLLSNDGFPKKAIMRIKFNEFPNDCIK